MGIVMTDKQAEQAGAELTLREKLRSRIREGIGYDLVPLSIRDHPEITREYRTAEDAEGITERTLDVLLPFIQETSRQLAELAWEQGRSAGHEYLSSDRNPYRTEAR